jgi:hypothetical protein
MGGTVRYNGKYTIASAYGVDIFLGDFVRLAATLNNTNIEIGAVAIDLLGVFAGCSYTAANGDVVFAKQWVADTVTQGSVDAEAYVYTDPHIVYTIQVNGSLSGAEAIGEQGEIDVSVAGNAATGVSGHQMAAATAVTAAQLRILRLAPQPDGIFVSDLTAANPRVEFQFSEHAQIAAVV